MFTHCNIFVCNSNYKVHDKEMKLHWNKHSYHSVRADLLELSQKRYLLRL